MKQGRGIKQNERHIVISVVKRCDVDEHTHTTQKFPYLSNGLINIKRLYA